jgi:UDP-N-acetyl-D-mannosaminuronate dehydrogenase
MSNIENADEKKISKLGVVGLGLVFLPLALVGAV